MFSEKLEVKRNVSFNLNNILYLYNTDVKSRYITQVLFLGFIK